MTNNRKETDSLGEVDVPADKLWGAQTQRSLEHFSIGKDLIPREMIYAYAILKKAAANANHADKRLDGLRHKTHRPRMRRDTRGAASRYVPVARLDDRERDPVQHECERGSNRCSQLAGTPVGSKAPVHPTDPVNMAQSPKN